MKRADKILKQRFNGFTKVDESCVLLIPFHIQKIVDTIEQHRMTFIGNIWWWFKFYFTFILN